MKFKLNDIVLTNESVLYRVDSIDEQNKLYNSNLDAEDVNDRYSFHESELELIASKDKIFSCPKCKSNLSNTEMSPGYVFGCDNCDEDFYYFEVVR
jgi:transcription initiation factor IIE alpha subunit